MASEWKPPLKEINGVNLANYFTHQRSCNSVLLIHKKYLNDYKNLEGSKEKLKSKKEKKYKYQDKGQQFNSDKYTEESSNKTYKVTNGNNQDVLDQTIRFAKNIVPLVIPQSDEKIPVFYTIKTTKKHRKKEKKPLESSFDHHGARHEEKRDAKKVYETYRKVRKESYSVRESLSQGSSNTTDDLNINQSLCCTFSEVSEKKCNKKDRSHHKKVNDGSKVVVSESFEALATENQGESKIKIHLMNEKDKHFLSDSIKAPILSALRECITEISNCNNNADIARVQKIVKINTSKLDKILERIGCIEKTLDSHALEKKTEIRTSEKKLELLALEKENSETHVLVKKPSPKVPSLKMQELKPSALEELEEDLTESKEDYSSEEELHQESLYRRSKSVVTEFVSEEKLDKKPPSSGCGEAIGGLKESFSVGVKPDRLNRIPARFCWTDAARK